MQIAGQFVHARIQPFAIAAPRVMLNQGLILRDQNVIDQGWVPRLKALELFDVIEL